MTAILAMIKETEKWRVWHKSRGSGIEAAACAIRLKALRDAAEALRKEERG